MNAIRKRTILIIEPDDLIYGMIQKILTENDYCAIRSVDLPDSIKQVVEHSPDLIVSCYQFNDYDAYHVYNVIENSILNNGVPFLVYASKFSIEEMQLGLELGIDNFLIYPFEESSLLRLIDQMLGKVAKHAALDRTRFDKIFVHSPMPICITAGNKIEHANPAFIEMFGISSSNELPLLSNLFDFKEDYDDEKRFFQCLKGMQKDCRWSNVSVRGDEKWVDIYVSHVNHLAKNSSLVQVVPKNQKYSSVETEQVNGFDKNIDNLELSLPEEMANVHLTPREWEVIRLSAKGLPIKQIAIELTISERTVEKHRSNVMQKTRTSNIIEVLRLLYSSNRSLHV